LASSWILTFSIASMTFDGLFIWMISAFFDSLQFGQWAHHIDDFIKNCVCTSINSKVTLWCVFQENLVNICFESFHSIVSCLYWHSTCCLRFKIVFVKREILLLESEITHFHWSFCFYDCVQNVHVKTCQIKWRCMSIFWSNKKDFVFRKLICRNRTCLFHQSLEWFLYFLLSFFTNFLILSNNWHHLQKMQWFVGDACCW